MAAHLCESVKTNYDLIIEKAKEDGDDALSNKGLLTLSSVIESLPKELKMDVQNQINKINKEIEYKKEQE